MLVSWPSSDRKSIWFPDKVRQHEHRQLSRKNAQSRGDNLFYLHLIDIQIVLYSVSSSKNTHKLYLMLPAIPLQKIRQWKITL